MRKTILETLAIALAAVARLPAAVVAAETGYKRDLRTRRESGRRPVGLGRERVPRTQQLETRNP